MFGPSQSAYSTSNHCHEFIEINGAVTVGVSFLQQCFRLIASDMFPSRTVFGQHHSQLFQGNLTIPILVEYPERLPASFSTQVMPTTCGRTQELGVVNCTAAIRVNLLEQL